VKKLFILSVALCSFIAPAHAVDWGNAAYANIQSIETEGDLIGWRIQVIHTNAGGFMLLQSFEGVPLAPCLVKAEINHRHFRAKYSTDCSYEGEIEGEIRQASLTVRFLALERNRSVVLRRVNR